MLLSSLWGQTHLVWIPSVCHCQTNVNSHKPSRNLAATWLGFPFIIKFFLAWMGLSGELKAFYFSTRLSESTKLCYVCAFQWKCNNHTEKCSQILLFAMLFVWAHRKGAAPGAAAEGKCRSSTWQELLKPKKRISHKVPEWFTQFSRSFRSTSWPKRCDPSGSFFGFQLYGNKVDSGCFPEKTSHVAISFPCSYPDGFKAWSQEQKVADEKGRDLLEANTNSHIRRSPKGVTYKTSFSKVYNCCSSLSLHAPF